MTIRSKATLKGYFNTGDKPAESNFADWIDTMPVRTITVGPSGSDADYPCDGTDDDVTIQAAIDAAQAQAAVMGIVSMADVELLRGQYNLGATLDVKADVRLLLRRGAVLNLVADVDGVNLKYGASIRGGLIYTGNVANYSSAAIKLDGSSQIYFRGYPVGAYLGTSIENISIVSGVNTSGKGIYMLADETLARGFINGVTVRDVSIWKFQYGIHLAATNLGAQPGNGVGGNFFNNVNLWFPGYGIYMQTATWEQVNGNTFHNLHIYAEVTETLKAIYCEGSYNTFSPAYCWDTGVGNLALEFAGASVKNRATGVFGGGAFVVQRDVSNVIDDYLV